jgi:hypothetical protein
MFAALFLIPLTIVVAAACAERRDRTFLVQIVVVEFFFYLPMLTLVNETMPFTGSGDDSNYFAFAATSITSLADLDLTQFSADFEQPGYPWLLTVTATFFGHNLLALKLLNLTIFINISIVWYKIGVKLESSDFGRAVAVVVALLTPFWYYFSFLLKDMVIVFLQSLFLLGLVTALGRRGLSSWLLMAVATIALIPFRSATVVINAAVLILTTMVAGPGSLGPLAPIS